MRLATLLGEGALVLYFYPKDETPGCTREAHAFRDSYTAFTAAGAAVVGISSDSVASHRRFASRHDLPFLLLSDRDEAVRKRYGVERTLGIVPGRVTFVIDRDGVVRHIFASQLQATRHSREAADALRALGGERREGRERTPGRPPGGATPG